DDAFGQRLREAGAAVTPETSEPLHARVMADVRREQAAASSAATGDHAGVGWWWMVGAAAAVLAIGVGLWVTASRGPGATPVPHAKVAHLPAVPSIESIVVQKVEPVRAKLHEARFAYLDRDTKRLARFLVRAVPGVPAEAKKAIDRDATPSSASGT
ncbi:MAG: hypothetical protein WBD40_18060, partial [Tepidisphaeraceae bacterium]